MANKVRWMNHSMVGAPIITNTWGSLTSMLDAALVNGFNILTPSSITATGTEATATFVSAHGYIVTQIIRVSGATQSEYNGDFLITRVTTNTITFTLDSAPSVSPATGTLQTNVAPLGFEIAFTGTNKRAYRSLNPTSTKPILRVDDSLHANWTSTYAKSAKVLIAENMTDIDTVAGFQAPYDSANPTRNTVVSGTGTAAINGWYKWFYARAADAESTGDDGAYSRKWHLIGDDKGFYLTLQSGYLGTSADSNGKCFYAFQEFESYKAGDQLNAVLFASDRALAASATTGSAPWDEHHPGYSNISTGNVLLGDYSATSQSVGGALFSLNITNAQAVSGLSGGFPYPNGSDSSIIFHPCYLRESNFTLRAMMPGLYWVHQNIPHQGETIISDVVGYPGRKYMVMRFNASSSAGVLDGCFLVSLDDWR